MISPTIEALFGERSQELLNQFGLQHEDTAMQESVLSLLGNNILDRIAIEVLEKLPSDSRENALALFESGDLSALSDYLSKEIPELPTLVKRAAKDEIRLTLASK